MKSLPQLGICIAFLSLAAIKASSQQRSVRFFGSGHNAPGKDRIKIPLEQNRVNVGNDFTIEYWLNADAHDNNGNVSFADHGDGWITGNVVIDRDVYGNADPGDFGMAIGSAPGLPAHFRVVAFGLNRKNSGITIQGKTNIADNKWHHIAITRDGETGVIRLFVDGQLDAEAAGPAGNIEYPGDRQTSYPESDPFLVIGAEKHDGGGAYPSYRGSLDELRISDCVRYSSDFIPQVSPFAVDASTAALFHFDDNEGDGVRNETGNTDGLIFTDGNSSGPLMEDHSPFLSQEPALIRSLKTVNTGKGIKLSWRIENSTSLFEIQRSADGKKFVALSQVNSHTCISCDHEYLDLHPLEGKNYYRIKYISSGKEKYSPLSFASVANTLANSRTNP